MIQRNTLSKEYYDYSYLKIATLLKVDSENSNSTEADLKEIYEDAFSIAENYIHKSIAYTLNEWIYKNIHTKELLIDEGNYLSISAITSTSTDGTKDITDYTVTSNQNIFIIHFNEVVNATELNIKFFTGYKDFVSLEKNIRRAIYIIMNDLFDNEVSSYNNNKKSDIVERLLDPFVKRFFVNDKYEHCGI